MWPWNNMWYKNWLRSKEWCEIKQYKPCVLSVNRCKYSVIYCFLIIYRWLRLRLNMMPLVSGFLEPLTEVIPLGFYGAWCMHRFLGINPFIFYPVHICFWLVSDYVQLRMIQVYSILDLSCIMRKPACICENKGANQLHSNCTADQRLCFRNIDSTIPLLPKSELSSLLPSFFAVQLALCQTWWERRFSRDEAHLYLNL